MGLNVDHRLDVVEARVRRGVKYAGYAAHGDFLSSWRGLDTVVTPRRLG
jgi:hypothetical protein